MKIENQAGIGKLNPSTQQTGVEEVKSEQSARRPEGRDSSRVSNLAKLIAEARRIADQLPDVRTEKITLAKRRLATGHYHTPEVREVLVDQLSALVKKTFR
jgi:hypothetical protein